MKDLRKLILSVVGCELVGILSTPFTLTAIPTWYALLKKPPFSPPNWLFGPVWTLLYLLMGVSFYLILKKKNHRSARNFFLLQLALNFLWSLLFFGLHSPILGIIEIVIMWFAILGTMRQFYPLSKTAFYLLIPYFFWVSFATLLNASIVILN